MALLHVRNPVSHPSLVRNSLEFPGLHNISTLKERHPGTAGLFPVFRGVSKDILESAFVSNGYRNLFPIRSRKDIESRQDIVRSFLEDLSGEKKLLRSLQVMHLIGEWGASSRDEYGHWHVPQYDLEIVAKIFSRYRHEAETLLDVMRGKNAVLEDVAQQCSSRLNRQVLRTVEVACQKKGYDYFIVNANPLTNQYSNKEHIGIQGVVSQKLDARSLPLGEIRSCIDGNMEDVLTRSINDAFDTLDGIFSVLGALYAEASYLFHRTQDGLPVCIPEINEEGVFEMVDGEPFSPVRGTPRSNTIGYGKQTARIILNGIHSGGKTALLHTIPHYVLAGLSGMTLPSRSANVPLIRKIYSSFETKKYARAGNLQSELFERVESVRNLRPGDLFVCDEFLQHASPDAAEYLEPVILDALAKTGATILLVTHRGERIQEGDAWQFYHPGYEIQDDCVIPTFRFSRGKPDPAILKRHASQMLEEILSQKDSAGEKLSPANGSLCMDDEWLRNRQTDAREHRVWREKIERVIVSGEYL